MSLYLSTEATLKFIELYQSESVIWDPKHAHHKDKTEVNEAWNRISEALQIPVANLKKKKESLMSAFRMHLKKKRDFIRSGEKGSYRSTWQFYDPLEAFLNDVYEYKSIMLAGDSSFEQCEPIESETEIEIPNETSCGSEANYTPERHVQRKRKASKSKKVKKVIRDDFEAKQSHHHLPSFYNGNSSHSARNNPGSSGEAIQSMPTKDSEDEDECDLYGRLLAKRLRKYSENERFQLMYEIDGLVLKRMRMYNPLHESSQVFVSKCESLASSNASPSPSSPYFEDN